MSNCKAFLRKTPDYNEVHEDPIALTGIRLKLNIPLKDVKAKTVISGQTLSVKSYGNGSEVTVPRVLTHEVVCFELG